MADGWSKFTALVRNFFLSNAYKEVLTFLFFLAVAFVFWFLMMMNETVEKETYVPVTIKNVPEGTIVTNMADSVKVTLHDKGFVVYSILTTGLRSPVTIDYKTTNKGNGTGQLGATELLRQVKAALGSSVSKLTISPTDISYKYAPGATKMVPVKLMGTIEPDKMHYLTRTRITPDSVMVFAPIAEIDDIKEAPTEALSLEGFADTLTMQVPLAHSKSAQYSPQSINLTLCTDILTEEGLDIPVRGVNVPEGKIIRTFPSKVKVKFITGVRYFLTLKASQFDVVVDYDEIAEKPQSKCKVYLHTIPDGISRATLELTEVDYLLENKEEGEKKEEKE